MLLLPLPHCTAWEDHFVIIHFLTRCSFMVGTGPQVSIQTLKIYLYGNIRCEWKKVCAVTVTLAPSNFAFTTSMISVILRGILKAFSSGAICSIFVDVIMVNVPAAGSLVFGNGKEISCALKVFNWVLGKEGA